MGLSSVPVFILAGGTGTRLSEETSIKPKPMVEIGGIPILVHIMRWYYSFGFNDFIICAGYKSWDIKEYFLNYECRQNHLVIDHRGEVTSSQTYTYLGGHEKWRVQIIDTGVSTMTGARLARAFDVVSERTQFDEFALTYGDGLADVDLSVEYDFHRAKERIGTVLGVPPISRFGEMSKNDEGIAKEFIEKPSEPPGLINGGFFFFNRGFRKYLSTDEQTILERRPLETLCLDRQLAIFAHNGFWQCMDTLRDKNLLQQLWESGEAPWAIKKS